jgi:carbamoyltransferase
VLGLSGLSHDAAATVVEGERIVFAAHAERYSRRKNDPHLHRELLVEALSHGKPDVIAWYERPYLKRLRHVRAGQWGAAIGRDDSPRRHVAAFGLAELDVPFRYVGHHRSHAAAGFATSGEREVACLTADAIGEFDTFTIGTFDQRGFRVLHRRRYPHSLGLLYSAITKRCGFRPNEDEYIVMGLAALGRPRHVDAIRDELLVLEPPSFRLRTNVHRGIGSWRPDARPEDLAASIQTITEEVLLGAARWLRERTTTETLVLMGGLALNCVANARLAAEGGFRRLHIMPNPGDAGSSLGAAAAVAARPLRWDGPYLGTRIDGPYPVRGLAGALESGRVVGVASGRAEFGPRALGNRSLLADPRGPHVKDRVNRVKGREPFRPFAPVVREERCRELFDLPAPVSPYMQLTARCRRPEAYPAIVHVDGTSRVQTVSRRQHPGLYALLLEFERRTGCPLLLNTSLNVKGEPLVNDRVDAAGFAARCGVEVLS